VSLTAGELLVIWEGWVLEWGEGQLVKEQVVKGQYQTQGKKHLLILEPLDSLLFCGKNVIRTYTRYAHFFCLWVL
jgi:hypothetical protein